MGRQCQDWVDFSDILLASENCLFVWGSPPPHAGIGSGNSFREVFLVSRGRKKSLNFHCRLFSFSLNTHMIRKSRPKYTHVCFNFIFKLWNDLTKKSQTKFQEEITSILSMLKHMHIPTQAHRPDSQEIHSSTYTPQISPWTFRAMI